MAGGARAENPGDPARSPEGGPAARSRYPRGAQGKSPSRPLPSLWLSAPWLAILWITGAFHFYRGVPVDGWIFLSAAVALSLDTAMRHRRYRLEDPGPARRTAGTGGGPVADLVVGPVTTTANGPGGVQRSSQAMPRWLWISTAAGVGVFPMAAVLLAPGSGSAMAFVVALVGASMLLVAWPDPAPAVEAQPAAAQQAPPRMQRAAWGWAAVLLFLALWELVTYFIDRFAPADAQQFPPLTDLLQPLFDADSSRWFMMMLWLLACGSLVRVVRRS